MFRYLKEIVIYVLQLVMFYIFPLFAGPTDTIGMVVLIIISVFILSFLLGLISKEKIKILYPILVSLAFIPSVLIYYNNSAFIHAIWYFVISTIGMVIGMIVRRIVRKKLNKEKK